MWAYTAGIFIDGHNIDSSPAVAPDGTVYVGTDPYGGFIEEVIPNSVNFLAMSSTGDLKWALTLGDGVESSPALGSDGMIYVGSYDHNLYAIRDHGDSGTVEWQFPTGGWIDGSPVVDGAGTIYVGSRDSTLYAINPDGSLRWSFPAGGPIEASPSIGDDGVLYIGTMGGDFYALGSPGPDVGVADLDIPGLVLVDDILSLDCTAGNFRAGAQSFEVTCSIATGGQEIFQDTIAISALDGGATQSVVFAPWTVGSATGVIYDITLAATLVGDNNAYNDTITAQILAVDSVTGVDDEEDLPPGDRISLYGNYPNPFNPATTIAFHLPRPEAVSLRIYDIAGRLVKTLVRRDRLDAGVHERTWDGVDESGRTVAAGVFFYRLEVGSFAETKRMTLVK